MPSGIDAFGIADQLRHSLTYAYTVALLARPYTFLRLLLGALFLNRKPLGGAGALTRQGSDCTCDGVAVEAAAVALDAAHRLP